MTDLVIKQGTTTEIRIPDVKDSAGVLITNWAGFSVKAQVRERPESTTVLHEWTSAGGTVTFSGSAVVLSVPAATSAAWSWTHGRYDVELTDPSSRVARLAEGHITVSKEVTR